jgi:hypothetical protein
MKRSTKIKSVTMALLIALTNYLCGCSVVGLGMGAAVDCSEDNYKIVEGRQLVSIKPGTQTVLNLRAGSQINGKYDGLAVKKTDNDITPDSLIILQVTDSLTEKTDYSYISLRSIESVMISAKKDAKFGGLTIGLLIDAAVVFMALAYHGTI